MAKWQKIDLPLLLGPNKVHESYKSCFFNRPCLSTTPTQAIFMAIISIPMLWQDMGARQVHLYVVYEL